jgi:hypothetical protein
MGEMMLRNVKSREGWMSGSIAGNHENSDMSSVVDPNPDPNPSFFCRIRNFSS